MSRSAGRADNQPKSEKRPVAGATVGRGGDRVTLDENVVSRADRHSILLASGYNKPKTEPCPDQFHACATRPIWTPWGWAVDLPRLKWRILHWCF